MVLVDACQPISKHSIEGIIDNVKNKLLDFVLDLENSDISLENNIEPEAHEQIRNLFNVNIYGNHNVVASGENIQQGVKDIVNNDIESLIEYFKTHGVPSEDLKTLEVAIEKDGQTPRGSFGKNTKEWIGNMISKASAGVWQVALTSAPTIITEGLKHYYGW